MSQGKTIKTVYHVILYWYVQYNFLKFFIPVYHKQDMLLTHADDLLCLQLYTVGYAFVFI